MRVFKDFMEQCLGIHNKKLQKELSDVAKLRTFFKGENLIRVEDKTKEVFLLMDGIVRGYFLKDDGRDFTDCFCFRAGTPITGGGGTDMPAKLNMEALSKVFVLGLPVSAVRELMKKYPELVRIQNCFFREFLEEHLENSIMRRTKKTGERYLWFCRKYPFLLDRISHRQISSFLGVTPQTLSKERKKLRKAGDAADIFSGEEGGKSEDGFCKAEEK